LFFAEFLGKADFFSGTPWSISAFFHPFGGGHGTPHCFRVAFVQPPFSVCLDRISSSEMRFLFAI
jgi:hypothetical protein